MKPIPLVLRPRVAPFARCGERTITVEQFCADVESIAATLPAAAHLINLCEDRYSFTVVFFAALINRQINLLPARRDAGEIIRLKKHYRESITVSNEDSGSADYRVRLAPGQNGAAAIPDCAPDAIAAIAFTSGSTGEPQAHPKSWQLLHTWRSVHYQYLPQRESAFGLVATVPSWHMYGLEWALLLPTIAPATLFCGADFFPQDVARALNTFTPPTVLVATPVHLRALLKSTRATQNLRTIISATAPLDPELAAQFEAHFAARVFEIYGCSEIGSLAYRYPTAGDFWSFFDCFDVTFNNGQVTVSNPQLSEAVPLADVFEQTQGGQYRLLGRTTDLIKVGGRRESLAHLNSVLHDIVGVEDGVIYDPAAFGLENTGRLAALAVAPTLTPAQIRTALARDIDSIFIPRPIRLVERIPRDKTSKIKQAELQRLAALMHKSAAVQ